MADDNKGGSGEPENKTAKISVDEALAENIALKSKIADLEKTIAELTLQLKAANDVLESQTKAKMIGEIMPRSNFTIEDLAGKSLEELQHIRMTLGQAKLPTYKNIRFGVAVETEDREDGLTVGDLSVVTAAKRKAGGN